MKTRLLIAVLALALLAGCVVTVASPAEAVNAADGCVSANLVRAPALDSDRHNDQTPIQVGQPFPGGAVPIVLIHGFTGNSIHDDTRRGAFSRQIDLSTSPNDPFPFRTLVGNLQDLAGTDVFTFDYHQDSAKWVDTNPVRASLGASIDCLARESGQQVILIAHSMGGLAIRQVLADDANRADRISQVITFGTPNTGSDIAAAAAFGIKVLPVGLQVSLRLLAQLCGGLATERVDDSSCKGDAPLRAFDSAAGRALQSGSRELARLPS